MSCCNRDKDPEIPDDLDSCCKIRGPRCMCLPYDDAIVITAMLLSIATLTIAWAWWISFIISIFGMVLFQLFWCCRQPKATPYLSVVAAFICSLFQLGAGFYSLVEFRNYSICHAFLFTSKGDLTDPDTDDYYHRKQDCEEVKWAIIAFVCAALWAIIACCILYFVHSGRHAKWEEARNRSKATATTTANPNNIVVELGCARSPEPSAAGRGPSMTIATAMAVLPSATGENSAIATATAVLAPESHKPNVTNS